MFQIIVIAGLACFGAIKTTANAKDEGGMSMFFLEYAVLQKNAFGGEGAFDDLMRLSELSPERADFIAEFWRARALMEVGDHVEKVVARVVKRFDGKDKEAMQKEAQQTTSYLFYSYYYDHWDAINKMIKQSLEQASKK